MSRTSAILHRIRTPATRLQAISCPPLSTRNATFFTPVRVINPSARQLSTMTAPKMRSILNIRPHYYEKPKRSTWQTSPLFRYFNDPDRVVYALIGINLAIFGGWSYAINTARQFSDPRAYITMLKNFSVSIQNVKEGRIWTLLTATFSHQETAHLAFNMILLYTLGPQLASVLGIGPFLALYLGAGIAASITSLIYRASIEPWFRRQQNLPPIKSNIRNGSLGASGSLMGITSFFALVFPRAQFLLFFVVPVPAWAIMVGYLAYDGWMAIRARGGRTDSAGHLGGLLTGILYWLSRGRLRGRM